MLAIAIGQNDVDLQMTANFSVGGLELIKRLRERLVWSLAELGEFAEARRRGEEAVQIAGQVDHHHSLILAYRSLGLVALRRGDISRAVSPLERAVVECRDAQTRSFFDVTAGHLGYAYALSGRLPEGVALVEEALADPGATGTTNHPLLLAYLGEAHLAAGRPDDAITVGRRAPDLAHRQKERGNEVWVLRLLGMIAARPTLPTESQPRSATVAPSPGPTSSACALSSPTATSASASSNDCSTCSVIFPPPEITEHAVRRGTSRRATPRWGGWDEAFADCDTAALVACFKRQLANGAVRLTYLRDGKTKTAIVTLGTRPS
jgi:tetratricopeptide (TPR) repeat protein